MDNDRRDKIKAAYERLGGPNARQLRYALMRDGVSITEKEAQEFINTRQESQVFRQKPQSDGRTAVRDKHDVMQVDLISLNQMPRQSFGNKFVLAVMDPFSGKSGCNLCKRKKHPRIQRLSNSCCSERSNLLSCSVMLEMNLKASSTSC